MNLRKIAVQLLILLVFVTAIPAANSQQSNLRGPKSSTPKYFEPQLQKQTQRQTQSGDYGPIISADTLWRISQNYRPNSSLSIYQVMQAIYELNPDAFDQQNINLLKNGSMLRMPSESYIAGVNSKQAQDKSQLDSKNLQPNTSNQSSPQAKNTTSLEQTRELIDQKLVAIDEAQNRQFMAIRKQFSESINSVQNILNENKKLFERLDKVNAEIDEMRSEEQQKSLQMGKMGKSIEELLEKSRRDDAEKAAQLAQEKISWLDNPVMLILLFTLPVLLALAAFAYLMIKRKDLTILKSEEDNDDFSLDPLVDEMDDLSDALSAELSSEGDVDLDDDDFHDDVLAEELEEAFDDGLDSDVKELLADEFDDLGDDDFNEEFEVGAGVVEQDDLDSLFAEEDELPTEEQESDGNSELGNELVEDDKQKSDDDRPEDDVSSLAPSKPVVEKIIKSVVDDEEQPEISIDELLDESIDKSVKNSLIDDPEDINEDVLQDLDKEIASQNEELDSVTGSLLDELEQVEQMRSMIPDDDDELSESEESQLDIQKLDHLGEKVDEFGEEDKNDEVEIDISEVLNETLQSVEADELVKSEPLFEAEESVQPDPSVVAKALVKPELSADTEALVEPEPSVEVEALVEPELSVEAEALAEPEPAVETEALAEPEPAVEVEALAEPEPAVEVEALAESEPAAEAEVEALVEPEPAAEAEVEALVEPEPAVDAEALVESEPAAEAEALVESEPSAKAEVEALAESEPSVETEALVESEPSAEVEALAKPEPDKAVEVKQDAEVEESVDSEPKIDDNIDEEDWLDTALGTEQDFEVPVSSDRILDEDQLEKALEDFEKEELDEVLEDLTSNVTASISSLDDLEFSADNFVTKDKTSHPGPTLDDNESIEDFDDSDLDNAFDENFDEESFASSQNSSDELDDLPGLGDWLDEDVVRPIDKPVATIENTDIIEELEDSSFDEMLESIDFDNDISITDDDEDNTGFDIAALLDESTQSKDLASNEQDADEFLDVESLLNESVSAESDDEIDKALDLEFPLEPFVTEQDNLKMIDVDADEGMGAKLDLAHAYIEIGEKESAKELLDEILQKGSAEQIAEVKTILDNLD